jgi:RING finger protein 121
MHYCLFVQSVDLSKLSEEEKWRLEHQRLHEKHRGHEAMHAEMVLILIVTLIVAQVVLVQWKQRHFRSYQVSSIFPLLAWDMARFSCMWLEVLSHTANR